MPVFVRLTDYKSSEEKEKGFFEEKNRYEAKQEDFFKIPGSPIAYWVSNKVINNFIISKKLSNFVNPRRGMDTNDNEKFLRYWFEINNKQINIKWNKSNIGGEFRKWEGNNLFVIDSSILQNASISLQNDFFKSGITWTSLSSSHFGARFFDKGFIYNNKSAFSVNQRESLYFLGFLSTKISYNILKMVNPTMNFQAGNIASLPIIFPQSESTKQKIDELTQECIDISKEEWDSRETSWDFRINELIRIMNDEFLMLNEKENNSKFKTQNLKLETIYNRFCNYWREKFYKLHENEEELNRLFIEIYGLEDELTPDVPLEDITILKKEAKIENNELVFDKKEIIKQFISYFVGVLFGRYSLDKEGLILANLGDDIDKYLKEIPNPTFMPDDDNIVPILDKEYFEDDIVKRFKEFLKKVFGEKYFNENLKFIEDAVGDIRKYFNKEFYKDHISRYKKRPIYWMVTSKNGVFKVLFYMHRFKSDIFARIRNEYLLELIAKKEAKREYLDRMLESASSREKSKIEKEIKILDKELKELYDFDKILQKYANKKFEIDLDDGVKVNYCKFKEILYPISNLCKK